MNRRLLAVGTTILGLLAFTSSAGAETLGITSAPTGTGLGCISGSTVVQTADTPATPFIVPSGGGTITQWQILTGGDTPGSSVTLLVLAPSGTTGSYTVVGSDAETIPDPVPSDGVASFTLAHPIEAAAGDTFGLVGADDVLCYYAGGNVPAGDTMESAAGATTVGSTLTQQEVDPSLEMAIAVTLVTSQDVAVQTATVGAPTSTGSPFALTSAVTNSGPGTEPITFTDQVPAGLQVLSATAGLGTCAVGGQTVTCTITGLPAGQSAAVDVLVTAAKPGSYANTVSVTPSGITDPNTANNTATATAVVAALPQLCIVPGLKKLPLASTRLVLKELGCRVAVVDKHSSLKKGLVIGAVQPTGTYPSKQLVTVIVSEGPAKKKKKRKKH
ncbi:MAG TPA: hypothetical protein VHU61_18680 [Solirubrobacteraceae bacterium]|nr:hypothetical protein [Solirubrobacteraceae bacterium]